MSHFCSTCQSAGVALRCSRCKQVYYCNAQCQSIHWKSGHKKQCKRLVSNSNRIQNDNNIVQDDNIVVVKEDKDIIQEWSPLPIVMSASYIGNGFIQITFTKWSGFVTMFEMKYKYIFDSNNINNSNYIKFFSNKLNKQSKILIRISQCINDYTFEFSLRAESYENQTPSSIHKWCKFTQDKHLLIPFDAPLHLFQKDETVQFMRHQDDLYQTGTIINILDGDIAEVGINSKKSTQAQTQAQIQDCQDIKTWKIAFTKLKFQSRYQYNIVDLSNWIDIWDNLVLSSKSNECKRVFHALSSNIYIYLQLHVNDMNEIYINDSIQDIQYCTRLLSFEIINFLYNFNDANKGLMKVNCGLCPLDNHYRSLMSYKRCWKSEIAVIIYLNKYNIVDMSGWDSITNGNISTMCDICQVTFHYFDYMYLCCGSNYNQHAICLSCMNRNVLHHQRLKTIITSLYNIHHLNEDCVLEIVYFAVGWIHSTSGKLL